MPYTERYVTNSGAGAHDGTSEANAWSWAEMLTNQAAGQRANVKGAITAAGTSTWTNAATGTAANPFGLRGYNSTIGDLANPTRTNGSGALVTTNWPVITTGGVVTLPLFPDVSNVCVKQTSGTGYVMNSSGSRYGSIYDLVLENSSTNGEVLGISTGGTAVINCDLIQSATTSTASIVVNRGALSFCRCTNPGGATGAAVSLSDSQACVENCQFYDWPLVFSLASIVHGSITQNSARNCDTFILNNDILALTLVADNVAWGSNAAGSEFYKGTASECVLLARNAYGNFADANQQLGNWPELQTISLTADPFTSASDLRLNSAAAGGSLCVGAGTFGNDIGAIKAAAAGGMIRHPGMSGGFNA